MAAFNRMRRHIQSPNNSAASDGSSSILVPSMSIAKALVRQLVPVYRRGIHALKDVLEAEENGELRHTGDLPAEFFEPTLE